MHPLIEELKAKGPILLDGAWGTQLQAQGLAPGAFGDEWNLTHPERVERVARDYVAAGSQVLLTNTFRANRLALENSPLVDRLAEINRTGVDISRRAADGRARVFAAVGPTGKMVCSGQVTEEELQQVFHEQVQVLAEAGAEGLVIETMSELEEARAALQAAKATGLPVIVTLVFDSGKSKDRTMMGLTPEQAAEALTADGADVIGANCGQGIAGYIPVCRRLRAATDRPVWIKPNAGLPEMVDGQVVYRTTPEEFARQVPSLREAGADFIGGCCGTSPDYIRAARRALYGS